MDLRSAEALEFPKIREILSTYCESTLGRELANSLEPMGEPRAIRHELELVQEMMGALQSDLAPPLGKLRDIRLLVRRAAIGALLDAGQLLEVAETLLLTGGIFRWRCRLTEKHHRLVELAGTITDLGPVARTILGCVDSRAHVLDMASPELGDVRRRIAELDEKLKTALAKLLKDPELRKILRYPNASIEGDRYVLPVSANHRHRVPGVVHRVSSTGETLFIEPASLANLGMDRSLLKAEEDKEVRKVLRRLTMEVGKVASPLGHAIAQMARIDFIQAKARYGLDFEMATPHISDEGVLLLKEARHPLLAQLHFKERGRGLWKSSVVPMEIGLGDGHRILVITGPNTGGKTVALKGFGLISLMALSGLPVPAGAGSSIPVFDGVFADIGDEQSLEQSLSTFSSHMTQISAIFRKATAKSLVLLDELGAGTDPTEGAALGKAILGQLGIVGSLAVVTTHLGEIKKFALKRKNMLNASVEFDAVSLKPTYRLVPGKTGKSCALLIAKTMGLPGELMGRAKRHLRKYRSDVGKIRELEKIKRREQMELRARLEETAAGRVMNETEEKEALERRRIFEKGEALRKWRESLHPGLEVLLPGFGQKGQIQRVDRGRGVAMVNAGLGQWEVKLEDILPP